MNRAPQLPGSPITRAERGAHPSLGRWLAKSKLLLNVRPESERSLSLLRRRLESFLDRHGQDVRIISFVPGIEARLEEMPIESWRAAFPQEEDFRLWDEAYVGVDRFVSRMNAPAREVLDAFYHECAFEMYEALVFDACLRQLPGPVVVLQPATRFTWHRSVMAFRWIFGWRRLWLRYALAIATRVLRIAGVRFKHWVNHLYVMWRGFSWRCDGPAGRVGYLAIRFARVIGSRTKIRLDLNYAVWRRFTWRRDASRHAKHEGLLRKGFRWLMETGRELWDLVVALRAEPDGPGGPTIPAIAVTVEDSGTGVNLGPALKVLHALRDRGETVLVLTTVAFVADNLSRAGFLCINLSENLAAAGRVRRLLNAAGWFGWMLSHRMSSREIMFSQSFMEKSQYRLRLLESVRARLEKLRKKVEITSVLTVYESLPLSVVVGRWAQARDIPWLGFFPILLGKRPDCRHFPATRHLVYGSHLTDLLTEQGYSLESIHEVGSPTYDVPEVRDQASDRAYVAKRFPGSVGKKLVVVATEAFPHPFVELDPVLTALADKPGVHVVLKLHPEDSERVFSKFVSGLRCQNIDVVKQCDLHALLHAADLLIAIVSNVIITAATMGTPTLACDFSGKSRSVDFAAEGLCQGCSSANQIDAQVDTMLFSSRHRLRMLEQMKRGLHRFNGPADGRSAERIASFVLEAARERLAAVGMPPTRRRVGRARLAALLQDRRGGPV